MDGNPTFNFFYDSQHRLVGYSGFNSHSLTLNSKGQAIIDTFIMNYAGQDTRYSNLIYYDALGRVSKVVSELYHTEGVDLPLPHQRETTSYRYDSRGNLILMEYDENANLVPVRYDHKTSIYRTNPVLMFIHRNYSLNNPVSDAKYNEAGLPLSYVGTFLEGSGEDQIVYDCENKSGN